MSILEPVHKVLRATGHDAIALVPGANFLRVFGKDFHQMERPLMVIVPKSGAPVAVVPNLELGSFTPIGFPGQVFDWRDEDGYMGAFRVAGAVVTILRSAVCEISGCGPETLLMGDCGEA